MSLSSKQIIESKLEILLEEYKTTEDRLKRLKPIIETYATRYIALTGKSYVTTQIDKDYKEIENDGGIE
jgi:hypothetical protein